MKDKNPKKQLNKFVEFSGMGFQMIITIVIGVVVGKFLDSKFPNESQIYTVILTLIFVLLALYAVVKKIINKQNIK